MRGWHPPLFIAARNGHLELTAELLDARAQVNTTRKDGTTPMYIAAQNGHLELVAILVVAGAWVNTLSECGATPLHIAVQNGHREVVAVLLCAGADIKKRWRIFGSLMKKSAIQAARENHHDDIVQMLVDWRRTRRG